MTVNSLLVRSYASNVYMTGMNSLSNIGSTRPDYVEPVKRQAAKVYYIEDIDNALTKGWITPIEHAETLSLKGPDDAQNRPPIILNSLEQSTEEV